jgi:hypothetical protein
MLSRYVTEISYAIRRRDETDKILSFPFWAILMLLTIGIASIYVIYVLIKRRDEHFTRQQALQEGLIGYFTETSRTTGRDLSSVIGVMTEAQRECKAHEERKGAALWTILSFATVLLASIYVMYFLTVDAGRHDKRQRNFIEGANSAFSQVGVSVSPPRLALPERSFMVYLIVLIAAWIGAAIGGSYLVFVTRMFWLPFLLFLVPLAWSIYWYSIIFGDFNDHFRAQWAWEDEVMRGVSQLTPGVPGVPLAVPPPAAPPPPPVAPPPPAGKKYCTKCGAEISVDAKFCPKCGAKQ